MDVLLTAWASVSTVSLVGWAWLVGAHGQFWRTDQRARPTPPLDSAGRSWPPVSIVVPARNEAAVLPRTLPTLLNQDYPGRLSITLVDDQSEDGTAEVARRVSADQGVTDRLTVAEGEPKPPDWSGKVWALHQGIAACSRREPEARYLLLTDADIAHSPDSLRGLVLKAEEQQLDQVSLMARLRVQTLWERRLVPAFVYFFAKLYPFRWANDRRRATAAAAGGCILVRRDALERSGGLERMAGAIIDDCALARQIKGGGGRIWLGLSRDVRSLRAYNTLAPFWATVSRAAFAQLNFSPLLLAATIMGML